MVPAIRNILGGFLFSGDDIYKRVAVLSGGERTRLAVARMLLRPSNTLLLDEPTNHLDLDSKDVLLEALEDYGGTLIFVSHDRYFVEKLATKIIEIGHGEAIVYPGTYAEFLWHKARGVDGRAGIRDPGSGIRKCEITLAKISASTRPRIDSGTTNPRTANSIPDARSRLPDPDPASRERVSGSTRRRRQKQRALDALRKRIADLESRIAEREAQVKEIETAMSAADFYDDRAAATAMIDRHQALMWEVGDLMAQWEALHEHASES